MTPELSYLVLSVVLTFIQLVIAAVLATAQFGLPTLAGNREDMGKPAGACGRAVRAHANMLESLVLFAILVLVAKAANVSTGLTVLGAQLFFFGRLAYAVVYLMGLPWVRTLTWAVAVIGMVLIAVELLALLVF
jgi:uncharacterized MAPEG superfamily protein